MTKQEIILGLYIGVVIVGNVFIVYRFWKWISSDGISLFGGKMIIDSNNRPVQYWILKVFVSVMMFLMVVGFASILWEYVENAF